MDCDSGKWRENFVQCGVSQIHMVYAEPQVEAALQILSLGGCALILGADWMWCHDSVTFSCKQGMVSIMQGEKR